MKRIYFAIETKKRELDSRLFLAIKAAERGYELVIGKKSRLYQFSNLFKTGIFVFKSIGPKNLKNLITIKSNGHKIVAVDEEGLTITNKTLIKHRIGLDCLSYIDYFFLWGEKHRVVNSEHCKNFLNILKPIGQFRVDILRNDFLNYIDLQAKKIKEKYNNFILITTKFSKYNHPKKLKLGKMDDDLISFNDRQSDVQKKNMFAFKNFIDNFSKSFPNQKIILRPHPGEDLEFWKNTVANYKNIILINDDLSTCYWIKACDFLISYNCTTALEAYFLKVPNINYSPFEEYVHDYEVIKSVSMLIKDEGQLMSLIENYKLNKKINDLIKIDENKTKKVLEYNIENFTSKKDSTDKFFDYLDKLEINNKVKKDTKTNIMINLKFYIKNKIIFNLNKIFKKNVGLEELIKSKFPSLTKAELQSKIDDIVKSMNNPNKFLVEEAFKGVFIIKKI